MSTYINALILLISGFLLFPVECYNTMYITGILFELAMFCFILVTKYQPFVRVFGIASILFVLLLPELTVFLPFLCYLHFYRKFYRFPLCCLLPLAQYGMRGSLEKTFFVLLTAALSFYLAYQQNEKDTLHRQIHTFRDDSVEKELQLKKQNRTLLENQDNQIYIATLQERNRIAREIHDNVGHMLSRSILQVGALLAICKDETLKPHLTALKETLDSAMNSIRSSVHDLHDESIDLAQSLHQLTDSFTFCEVTLDCEISRRVPKEIKYSFLAIVKEALNNTMKHSNASKVQIAVKEQPGFYQLLIEDNGTTAAHDLDTSGIGLSNMKERADALHGILHIRNDSGFRIFLSVPKP